MPKFNKYDMNRDVLLCTKIFVLGLEKHVKFSKKSYGYSLLYDLSLMQLYGIYLMMYDILMQGQLWRSIDPFLEYESSSNPAYRVESQAPSIV